MAGEGFGFSSSSSSVSLSESEFDSSDSLLSLSLDFAGVRTAAAVGGGWTGNGGRVVSLCCIAGVVIRCSEDSSSDSDEVSGSVVFDASACVLVAIVSSSSLSLSTIGVDAFGPK